MNPRTGEQIEKDVVDQLAWDDRLDASAVTLSGIVRSPSARRAAQRAAEDAPGFTGIRNDIIVR